MRPRAGAGVALLGLGLFLLAGLLDAEPLYVPGIGLLVLALAAWAWVALAAAGAGAWRELDVRRVPEGEAIPVTLRVRSAGIPLPGGAVEDPLLPRPVPLPPLRPRTGGAPGEHEGVLHLAVSFARRGRRTVEPPALLLRDPLGLVPRRVRGRGEATELLVLPLLLPVRTGAGGGDGGLGAGPAAATDLDGLRPYREGASASRIHWPAVARTGELIERRLRTEGDARPVVVLDARAPDSEAALDAAVRAAASLAHALGQAQGCALLLPQERRPADIEPDLGSWALAHARLALVEAGGPAPVPDSGAARRGAVLYVAARSLTRLPAPWASVARGPRFVVVPEEAAGWAGRAPAFRVAGCAGHALRAAGLPARLREAAA